MSEENKALARREVEEFFSEGNIEVANEIYAVDFVDHDLAIPMEMRGPEEMKEYVGMYHAAFPDFRVTLEDQVAEGEKVVNRWTAEGTHQGEFMGVAPTGNRVRFTGMHLSCISGGRLVESWQNYDSLGLLRQIGAVDPPGGPS